MFIFIVVCILILCLIRRRESFSLEFKTDFGKFGGFGNVTKVAKQHMNIAHSTMSQLIPSRLRDLHRQIRRRKFL